MRNAESSKTGINSSPSVVRWPRSPAASKPRASRRSFGLNMMQVVGQPARAAASAGDRQHSRRDVRHAGRAVRAAGNGPRPAQAEDGGRPGLERRSGRQARPLSPPLCPLPRHLRRRRRPDGDRSSIPIRATIARASSSSRAPSTRSSRPTTTCTTRSWTASPARRCRRSRCCRRTKSRRCLEYVKYLSMRGQMETALVGYIVDNLDYDPVTGEARAARPGERPGSARRDHGAVDRRRRRQAGQPDEQVVVMPEEAGDSGRTTAARRKLAASVKAGRELFYGTKANCVKCHGPTGLGDGQQDDFDIWSKADQEVRRRHRRAGRLDRRRQEELSPNSRARNGETAKAELQAKQRELSERAGSGSGSAAAAQRDPAQLAR